MNAPTVEELRALLVYDPEAGALTWKARDGNARFNAKHAGKPAFTAKQGAGYPHGSINGKFYLAHRVAWAMHYGAWPQQEIDHINGVRSDFRIENLRSVTRAENAKNIRMSAKNTSGAVGVSWAKALGKWVAYLQSGKKTHHLGFFDSFEDAAFARQEKAAACGFSDRHGTAT